MHHQSPLHNFLFDCNGKLLHANRAAVQACRRDTAGSKLSPEEDMTLKSLFLMGSYPGGQEEAEEAYEEAVNAIFVLQVQCHRHNQPRSLKIGKVRWEMIEMWPMQDPVDGSPAVLVKRYNITQQKEIEMQLSAQQEALQRHNQALEQDSIDMQEERVRLEKETLTLTQRMEVLMHDKFEHTTSNFDAETPIEKVLNVLQAFITQATTPSVETVINLYHILSESGTHLRQPVALEEQLMKDKRMGSDVGKSMLQLLQGTSASAPATGETLLMKSTSFAGSGSGSASAFIPADITPAFERMLQCSCLSPHFVPQDPVCMFPWRALLLLDCMPDLQHAVLQDAETNWQFDIFAFAEATPGSTLSMLTFHLYKQAGLVREFKLDERKLCNFLQKVESGYSAENPYHNSIHAASVVQMTHMLLCHGGLIKSGLITKTQQLSSYWSAAVHDYEHGGLNNDFLIKTSHALAVRYNDQSPLENHHMSAAVQLLFQPDYSYIAVRCAGPFTCFCWRWLHNKQHLSWFDMLRSETIAHVRSVCVNQVLGTDMKRHFDITSRFQSAFKQQPVGSGGTAAHVMPVWDNVKAEDKTLVYQHHMNSISIMWQCDMTSDKQHIPQMVLKCADIGHLAVDPKTHKRWAFQLEEEFFRQGDKEKEAGLAVSPLMDRSMQGGMTRSQLGFFNIVGIPLFKAIADLFEESQPMLDGVLANFRQWEEIASAQPDVPA
ncbi:MAG: hypothetical protein FRX49_06341 [Trebouxia sp. A1-2]|nr:MAG: hypothetical protein FRX49_06341 [Trebouxia sp. A1-2]